MDGGKPGRALWDELERTIVHRPGDDLSQPIDYAVAAKFADVFRRVVLATADARGRPLWYEDSLFRRLAPGQPTAPRPR
jgi:hypothetical protein